MQDDEKKTQAKMRSPISDFGLENQPSIIIEGQYVST